MGKEMCEVGQPVLSLMGVGEQSEKACPLPPSPQLGWLAGRSASCSGCLAVIYIDSDIELFLENGRCDITGLPFHLTISWE